MAYLSPLPSDGLDGTLLLLLPFDALASTSLVPPFACCLLFRRGSSVSFVERSPFDAIECSFSASKTSRSGLVRREPLGETMGEAFGDGVVLVMVIFRQMELGFAFACDVFGSDLGVAGAFFGDVIAF